MSTDRDTKRIVRSWLRTDERESADRVLDAVLDRLDTTPQRRAIRWPARRFPEMNNSAKLALAAAAVVVAAFLGLRFLVPGDPSVGGDPDATATSSPTTTPNLIPLSVERPLDAGRYWLGPDFPVELSFELAEGWISCSAGNLEQGVCPADRGTFEGPPRGAGVVFQIVDNVVTDPCDLTSLPDPPIGPSVDDLVTAISSLPGFDVTPTEDVSVDGFDGKRFTVTAPEDPGCDLRVWATTTRTNGVGPGEANLLYVIDVDGERVMIASPYFPSGVTSEDLSAAADVIASIQIEP
jgi:hypothetical protein